MTAPADDAPHPESLVRVPLVRHMLTDPCVRLVPRAVDARWRYERVVPTSAAGFNPATGAVYYPARSCLARWLADRRASARPYNPRDLLVGEALFAVHDYLHVWAYRAVDALYPRAGLGVATVTPRNVEDLAFCHLLTEAAATVGLDYWYLCTLSLNDACDLGTELDAGLTVSFHERHREEYRRFCPGFDAQRPEFFEALARFYCTGVFEGFGPEALERSPRVASWIGKEIRYGAKQRQLTRAWLSFLAPDALGYEPARLRAPVGVDKPWQRRLVRDVGALLWAKVKTDAAHGFSAADPGRAWCAPQDRPADFRFVNLRHFTAAGPDTAPLLRASELPDSRSFEVRQMIAECAFDAFDPDLLGLLPGLLERRDVEQTRRVLRRQARVPADQPEPRELFFLG